MSILLSYYKLYGEIVNKYEPVLTKQFFHGRTEAMRSTTPQASSLCRAWTDPSSTEDKKLEALRIATKHHGALIKQSLNGKGVDRHLYALKCIAEKKGLTVPPFFQSKAWEALNHTVLSTSNCGNPALRLFGFGPVVNDGFGIGFIIKEDGLQYSISSKLTSSNSTICKGVGGNASRNWGDVGAIESSAIGISSNARRGGFQVQERAFPDLLQWK